MAAATIHALPPVFEPLPAVDPSARRTRAFAEESAPAANNDDLPAASLLIHSKQYRVIDTLGEGGMGTVYRAYDSVLERDVALKVMKGGLPGAARQRFRQEAIYCARMSHPNLPRVFDLGFSPGHSIDWYAMEYLHGRDLELLLTRAQQRELRFSVAFAVEVFDGVLDALQHAHSEGIVHRDVKPGNIFVGRRRHRDRVWAKLLDFGVAFDQTDDDARMEICGDPRYIAPEQALGSDDLDARADLYAAGIALFEVLSGEHPFADLVGKHHECLLEAQCTRELPRLGERLPSNIPLAVRCGLEVIVNKACEKDPDDRFDTAAAMRRALLDAVGRH